MTVGKNMARLSWVLGVLTLGALMLACLASNAAARQAGGTARLSGSVRAADGSPMEGVGVSARADDQRYTTTVYTDASGAYSFPELSGGHYKIWAQTVGFAAGVKELDLSGAKKADFSLTKLANFEKQLSGPELLASLPENGPADRRMKEVFANVCTSCHSAAFPLQNRFDSAGWNTIVSLMSRTSPTGVVTPEGTTSTSPLAKGQMYVIGAYKDELVAFLAKERGPDSPPLVPKAFARPSGDATRIVVTEYDLTRADHPADWVMPHNGSDWSEGTPSRWEGRGPHDVVVDHQGIVWFADDVTPGRTIGKLDPKTGKVTDFVLTGANGKVDSTHAITVDPDGNVWAADDTAGAPLEFFPETEKFKTYPKPAGDFPRVGDFITADLKGNIWAPFSAGAAKLDPQTGKYTLYSIPTKDKSTYGIDIDKNDNVWIAGLTSDKISFIDAATGESSEYKVNPRDTKGMDVTDRDREIYATMGGQNTGDLLQVGPRRLATDRNGDSVWWAEHFANRIGTIDINTKKVSEVPMPHPYMQPYGIAVDKDHMVWVTSIASDRVVRFNPATNKITEYDMPTRGTEARHIFADNRTDPPTIWIPYDRTNKIARIQFRTGTKSASAGN